MSRADLERALTTQEVTSGRIGRLLVRMGALSEDALLPPLADHLGVSLLSEEELRSQAANILQTVEVLGLSRTWLADQGLAVFESADGVIHCATAQPQSAFLREVLAAQVTGHVQQWHLIRSRDEEWIATLLRPEAQGRPTSDQTALLREMAEEAPVIELVNGLLAQAKDEGASDIHVEPEETEFFARFRIDGILQTRAALPIDRFAAVASRVKLIAGLDIAERRLPQDGRVSVRVGGSDIDIRVSVVPGTRGESIVMRLLPVSRADFSLESLGLEKDHLGAFRRWARDPNGIVLVTGPTGSGKSTTLYAALSEVNDRTSKIITVEDPVEYRMKGITQIQTQAEIGYTFGRALRAILRQDPDIIMIGEIRDLETAEIGVQAALTGHMVFSTLHTNDSLSSFTRLIDMGVEPFLVASSVRAVLAQRLLRRLCPDCAVPSLLAQAMQPLVRDIHVRFPHLFTASARWLAPKGCPACQNTGYRGRLGIYELVEVTPPIQGAIMQRLPAADLAQLARSQGCRTLREDGVVKAYQGLTSLEEVLRVTGQVSSEDA